MVPAAFVLAKHRRRWTGKAFAFVLLCLLVPCQVTMIPLFIGLNQAGLADTLASLILPFSTSVLGIFMIRQQMMAIPDALMEAAAMDGLGPVRTLLGVAVPMARPGIAAFSVYSIFVHWNDYMWPLLVARSPEVHPAAGPGDLPGRGHRLRLRRARGGRHPRDPADRAALPRRAEAVRPRHERHRGHRLAAAAHPPRPPSHTEMSSPCHVPSPSPLIGATLTALALTLAACSAAEGGTSRPRPSRRPPTSTSAPRTAPR